MNAIWQLSIVQKTTCFFHASDSKGFTGKIYFASGVSKYRHRDIIVLYLVPFPLKTGGLMRSIILAIALLASGLNISKSLADCFIKAGQWYSIYPDYLRAIA
ncbi:hypothetical protein [Erwinia sp. S38]|uniref:hypothetical protein n=1 Tax=Erwinia sp. S38 TaxID=2769338 RepID=UPI001909C343|nr:hypothetical protein [Erwinia sp. S38]MBK0004284.1 hypothetical protein [Erwinia sp. S38]